MLWEANSWFKIQMAFQVRDTCPLLLHLRWGNNDHMCYCYGFFFILFYFSFNYLLHYSIWFLYESVLTFNVQIRLFSCCTILNVYSIWRMSYRCASSTAKIEQLFGYDWIFKRIFSRVYLGKAWTINTRYNESGTSDGAQPCETEHLATKSFGSITSMLYRTKALFLLDFSNVNFWTNYFKGAVKSIVLESLRNENDILKVNLERKK